MKPHSNKQQRQPSPRAMRRCTPGAIAVLFSGIWLAGSLPFATNAQNNSGSAGGEGDSDKQEFTNPEEAGFERDLATIQRKLASASTSVLTPAGMPDDLRAFLDSPPNDIERVTKYYELLTSILNDLVPVNPYQPGGSRTTSLTRAEQSLMKLSEFPEDEWISRSLINHIQAVRGSMKQDSTRVRQIDNELKKIAREVRHKEWNFENESSRNMLNGLTLGRGGQAFTAAEILSLKEKYRMLTQERALLTKMQSPLKRRVQFQVFILELTAQQRYIHALIACGYYRQLSKDTTFDPEKLEEERLQMQQESYQQDQQYRNAIQSQVSKITDGTPAIPNAPGGGPNLAPVDPRSAGGGSGGGGGGSGQDPAQGAIPKFNSITGLETFLSTRIHDSQRKRKAFDGMIAGSRYGSAQALLVDFHATARHQPELHTIPYEVRQNILEVGTKLRHLSEALTSLDYEEIGRLAEDLDSSDSSITMTDVKAFAKKYPVQARIWARQAEVLSESGDYEGAEKMMEDSLKAAPLDTEVQKLIGNLQDDLLEKRKTFEELERVVEDEDYRTAHERIEEFLPLAESGEHPQLRRDLDDLLEMEKTVQTALEKAETLEKTGNHAGAWMEVTDLSSNLSDDRRLESRRGELASRCSGFTEAYYSAKEHDNAGNEALALAWYLNVLEEVPSSDKVIDRIEELSNSLAKAD